MPDIIYAEALAPLEKILSQVERPGDYFASESVETPMPLFEIDGVGLLSFPVPPEQCQRLITSAAERAPLAGPVVFASVLETLLNSQKDAKDAHPITLIDLWCELVEAWKDNKDAEGLLGFLFDSILPHLGDVFYEDNLDDAPWRPAAKKQSAHRICSPAFCAISKLG
ncbi:MAG: hypothetical protein WD490_03550 [Opitutales bacterium]